MTVLSERMSAVTRLVTPGLRIADIGCDHAYLSLWLIQNEKAVHSIACDVNEGPLMKAESNIRQAGLSDVIETRLGDGLQAICPGEVDSVIIAGMGGLLMIKILNEGRSVTDSVRELILQPQSDIDLVRHYLEDNGFVIVSEDMVCEDGKFYPMMKAIHGNMEWEAEVFYRYGKILLREENPVLHEFLIREKRYLNDLADELAAHSKEGCRAEERLKELKGAIAMNAVALRLMTTPGLFEIQRELLT